MSGSDTLAKRVTGTGSVGVGPARVRGFQVTTGAGAGRLTITQEGVRVSDIYVSVLTNITAVTIFYN